MKKFTSFLTLLTTSFTLIFPQDHLPQVECQAPQHELVQRKSLYAYSYDEILTLLDDLESGELEKRATIDDLEYIQNFIVHLAREGILPDQQDQALEEDIVELLGQEDDSYYFAYAIPDDYMFAPSFMGESFDSLLCKKSWIQKQWKQTKKFVKEHKTEIIVGTAVVVVAAAVVTIVIVSGGTAAPAVPAIVGSAAVVADTVNSPSYHKQEANPPPPPEITHQAPILKSAINEQMHSFKERVAKEEYLAPTNPVLYEHLTWEENTRIMGSLFAHESLNQIEKQMANNPSLLQEVEKMARKYPLPALDHGGHAEIDLKFSTDYSHFYKTFEKETDFNTLPYLTRGEKALTYGYFDQAVEDFGKAITLDPTNPLLYLDRAVAHLGLGNYEHSLADYQQFTYNFEQTYPLSIPLSIPEFTIGFAKGLPKGIYDSGQGMFTLLSDVVSHPIHTGKQMWEALTLLSELAKDEEWVQIREVLVPEINQLITEWETLPSDIRGELAGRVFGKYGADILIPGACAKTLGKLKNASKFLAIQKGLKTTEKTLLLETAAGLKSTEKVAELVKTSQKTFAFENPVLANTLELFDKAEEFLKPYSKKFLSEIEVRELIQQVGIQTFPRPPGIPESYRIIISKKGAGMKYVHPKNTHTYVRVMPGKPHSSLPHQQKPYVNHRVNGRSLDKNGKVVPNESPDAHIPIEEFVFKGD